MLSLSLNGSWELTELATRLITPATVPGCVHTDLLAAGKLPDPWYRDQELAGKDLWEKDWSYRRTFVVPLEVRAQPHIVLRCAGLDTVAEVYLNDRRVLQADNMFRTWEADVKAVLREGENEVEVRFPSPAEETRRLADERPLPGWNHYEQAHRGKSYLRKMACAFGWDWGLRAPTAGIWKGVELLGFSHRLENVRVQQVHTGDQVKVVVSTPTVGTVRTALELDGQMVVEGELSDGAVDLEVPHPQLWWPNGLGAQPLYTLRVELLEGGKSVDSWDRRIGLRKLELIQQPDEWGTCFRFRVNGVYFFAKGANWIPCSVWPSSITRETYADLLESAADSGMNMIRVWGGGIYEHDAFYDLCDERGILLWHDFMFACSTYPTFQDAFIENVRQEAIEQVQRLRHHACLALWCGNNELEQGLVQDAWTDQAMSWADYKPLFDDVLKEIVETHDGATAYWPSSPHTPGENRSDHNDPSMGDAHAWSVWFGGQPFEAQRNWTFRFMSEFGFQSFPEPRTVEAFTAPEDRQLTSWIMDFHQRSAPGNKTIFNYLLDWFCPPKSFEESLWLTQLTQALCIQYAAEHARRIPGRMDGLLYWQLNDLWPGATWSSIDVHGRWKALQFFAKRFFAPALVSVVEDLVGSTMALHVSNHRREELVGELHWQVMSTSGESIREGRERVSVPSQTNRTITTLDLREERLRRGDRRLPLEILHTPHPPFEGDRELICFVRLLVDGEEVSRNLATFARPKHLLLSDPQLKTTWEALTPTQAQVTVAASKPSPWTRMEVAGADVRYSDNFCHVLPGAPAVIQVTSRDDQPLEAESLRVVALRETWTS